MRTPDCQVAGLNPWNGPTCQFFFSRAPLIPLKVPSKIIISIHQRCVFNESRPLSARPDRRLPSACADAAFWSNETALENISRTSVNTGFSGAARPRAGVCHNTWRISICNIFVIEFKYPQSVSTSASVLYKCLLSSCGFDLDRSFLTKRGRDFDTGRKRGPIVKRAGAEAGQPRLSPSLLLLRTAGVTIRNLNVRAADCPDTALGSGSVGCRRKSTVPVF